MHKNISRATEFHAECLGKGFQLKFELAVLVQSVCVCVCGGGGGQGAQSEHAFAARSTLMQFHSIGMHMAAVQFQGSSSQPLLMSVYLCVYLKHGQLASAASRPWAAAQVHLQRRDSAPNIGCRIPHPNPRKVTYAMQSNIEIYKAPCVGMDSGDRAYS